MSRQLIVDWPACRARGHCYELLPEALAVDDWGYPVVTGPVTEELLASARAAARACPTLALRIVAGSDHGTSRRTRV